MEEAVHKLGPNLDTVIILEDPTANFTIWDTSDDTLAEDVNELSLKSGEALPIARKVYRRDYRRVLNDDVGLVEARHSSEGISDDATSSNLITDTQTNSELTEDESRSTSIQYLVSSRHLMLASGAS